MLFFEVGNLLAERGLGDVQSVRSPREVPLFGQDNDGLQVADFNLSEHGSTSFSPSGRDLVVVLHLVKEREGQKKYQKELTARGLRCRPHQSA
jgi:hypothetical protein